MRRIIGGAAALLGLLAACRAPDDAAISLCRGAYDRARTAGDSAAVDLQRPVTSRDQATVALDCRTFRVTGRLRTR